MSHEIERPPNYLKYIDSPRKETYTRDEVISVAKHVQNDEQAQLKIAFVIGLIVGGGAVALFTLHD